MSVCCVLSVGFANIQNATVCALSLLLSPPTLICTTRPASSPRRQTAARSMSQQDQLPLPPATHDSVHAEQVAASRTTASQLKAQGNDCFRNSDYERAVELYSAALDICPDSCSADRCVLLSNRAAARSHLNPDDREGVVDDCSKSLELDDRYLKPRLRRAQTYRLMGGEKLDAALADYRKILELDPDDHSARRIIFELEAEISERNEKLKKEMLSKLKDLGDAVLRPFGLSTNNFQVDQNESGGYSVNFKTPSGETQT